MCVFSDGREPTDFEDLLDCMEQAACVKDTEDQMQMAVFRDPRAVATSTYNFARAYAEVDANGDPIVSLDDFVLEHLPVLSQWIALRFILFGSYLDDQSVILWYEDAKADPLRWHLKRLASFGLHPPEEEVQRAVNTAVRGEFNFNTKGIDKHAGDDQDKDTNLEAPSFQYILKDETQKAAKAILRTCLLPQILIHEGGGVYRGIRDKRTNGLSGFKLRAGNRNFCMPLTLRVLNDDDG